jgi:hypothetical protein
MIGTRAIGLTGTAVALALLASRPLAAASLAALGPEVRVDGGAASYASCPLVEGGANGSFEVVWTTIDPIAPRNSHPLTRHFSWQGLPTEPPRELATNNAFPLSLARLPGGGFRASWIGSSPASSSVWWTSVLGEFGDAVTPWRRLRVLPYGSVLSLHPSGAYVTVTSQPRQGALLLRFFDAGGHKIGREQRLNVTGLELSGLVRFVHPPDGGFLVFWSGATTRSDGTLETTLFSRLYSSAGEPLSGENLVASVSPDPPGVVAFAGSVLPDGRVALAWKTDLYGIQNLYLQILSPAGAPVGPPVIVADGDIEYAGVYLQGIAVNAAGQIAVLWQRETEFCLDSDFQCDHLFARLYDSSGASLGEPVAIDTPAVEPFDKAFCGSLTAAGESFVASWQAADADGSFQYVVFARRLAVTTP